MPGGRNEWKARKSCRKTKKTRTAEFNSRTEGEILLVMFMVTLIMLFGWVYQARVQWSDTRRQMPCETPLMVPLTSFHECERNRPEEI